MESKSTQKYPTLSNWNPVSGPASSTVSSTIAELLTSIEFYSKEEKTSVQLLILALYFLLHEQYAKYMQM